MRVESVEALAFGPLDRTTLDLPEGMTLVFGPNEAGKSSWHGALYAAVCGIRRARGRPTLADQAFETRYRPWDGDSWTVRAVVALGDGRRIELTQDLDVREGTAIELATGRDITNGILNDQVPDASRWLGLDREAFRAVACVPQTALLQIRQQPRQLAEHLQRAAATAGTDATAAEAIKRLDEFLADRVGTERAWTKPLAVARAELTAAQESLRSAEHSHADLARRREELREVTEAKEAAARQLRVAEAADARQHAEAAREVLQKATQLSVRYPEPPPELAADDQLAQRARAAIDGYRDRPAVPAIEGQSAAEVDAELAALPEVPAGDLLPAPEVEAAHTAVLDARTVLRSVRELQPPTAAAADRTREETSELRRLADALDEPLPEAPTAKGKSVSLPGPAPSALGRPSLGAASAVAVILAIAGTAVATIGRQPAGWLGVAAGAVVGAALLVAILRAHTRQIAVLQVSAGSAEAMRTAAEQRIASARMHVAALGLPEDATALRDLADADDQARVATDQWAGWRTGYQEAESTLNHALEQLAGALSARGISVTGDPDADFLAYGKECARLSQQAAEAGRRPGLEARLRDRRIAEEQAAASAGRRSDAEQELRAAAHACHLPEADTAALDDLAQALGEWLDKRADSIGQREQAVADFAVLQQLLEGGTLDELKDEADRLADVAQVAARGLGPAEIESTELGADPMATLRDLRATAQEAREKVTELQSTMEERERSVSSVAAAEEVLAQASAGLDRLRRLGSILGTARAFLAQAQDTVHRSIAPRLAAAIAPNLADLTAGRYTEVAVDPDELQVRVRAPAGVWREADRLSHGTAEQIYLLLRAALAQYLVTTSESCPLILDDPTAYADDARTTAVLEVLHRVSTERQVVVFSHDTNVLAWARNGLNDPRDKIIELAELTPA